VNRVVSIGSSIGVWTASVETIAGCVQAGIFRHFFLCPASMGTAAPTAAHFCSWQILLQKSVEGCVALTGGTLKLSSVAST
jgi:hypothetical protein